MTSDLTVEPKAAEQTEPSSLGQYHVVLKPRRGLASLGLDDLWLYRELLYFMVWRSIKVRYKQTLLGILWIVLQPVVTIAIFTLLFGRLLNVPTGGVPYPAYAFSALVPWSYFAAALTRSSQSVVHNAHLITKVYFPRLIIPVSAVVSGLVDFAISFVLLLGLILIYGIEMSSSVLLLPAFLLLAMATSLGFGLWLAALNVRFRDVNYVVPFLVQLWMYVTPVIYGSTLVPERFRFLLALNPMTGVVEGFRWALLGNQLADARPPGELFPVSIAIALLVLIGGLFFFRTTERSFADII